MPWIENRGSKGFAVRWRDGSRKVQTKLFPSEKEAERFLAFSAQYFAGLKLSRQGHGGISLEDSLTDGLHIAEVRAGTREHYLSVLRTHIAGTRLGRQPIADITGRDIEAFWSELRDKGAGSGALRNVWKTLNRAFNSAIRKGLIDVSPLKRTDIRPPSQERATEVEPLTVSELETLADATRNQQDRLCILLAGYAGLRAGEIGGLRVSDLDFLRCRVSVKQAVARVKHGVTVGPVKTKASRRTLTVACSLVEEISAFVTAWNRSGDDLIFRTHSGRPVDAIVLNRACETARRRSGSDLSTSTALGTLALSILIDRGANARVQQYLGHANVAMTLGRYGHLFVGADQALADSMEAARQDYRANGKVAALVSR